MSNYEDLDYQLYAITLLAVAVHLLLHGQNWCQAPSSFSRSSLKAQKWLHGPACYATSFQ